MIDLKNKLKVVKEYEDEWNIVLGKTILATIHRSRSFVGGHGDKTLYFGNKSVCRIKNQKEAIEKLINFLEELGKGIIEISKDIKEIEEDIKRVSNENSKLALKDKLEELKKSQRRNCSF